MNNPVPRSEQARLETWFRDLEGRLQSADAELTQLIGQRTHEIRLDMSQESAFLKIHGREVYATVIARSVDLDPPALPKTALTRPNAARPVKNQTVRSDRGFERLSFFLFPAIYREAMLGDLLELRAQMRKTRMSRRQIQWATALHLLDAAWRRPASFLLIQPAIRVIRWCVSLVDRLV